MWKTFIGSRFGRSTIGFLIALIIRSVKSTTRWQILHTDRRDALYAAGKPFIVAFWHNRIMMMVAILDPDQKVALLQSRHRDGQLMSNAINRFGVRTIWGSTSKGGSAGLRSMIKALKNGERVAITPDGPRGPRMRCNPGVIALARLSGASIVPITYSASRFWALNTWDRFILTKPFGRGALAWGAPISVPHDLDADDFERYRLKVEHAMNDLVRETDAAVGAPPIEPAPSPINSEKPA